MILRERKQETKENNIRGIIFSPNFQGYRVVWPGESFFPFMIYLGLGTKGRQVLFLTKYLCLFNNLTQVSI